VEDSPAVAGEDTPAAGAVDNSRPEVDTPTAEGDNPAVGEDSPVAAGVDTRVEVAAGSNRPEAGNPAAEADSLAVGVDIHPARLRPAWCRTAGKKWFPGLPAYRSSDRRKQEECRRHCRISGLPNSARRISGILSTVAYYSP